MKRKITATSWKAPLKSAVQYLALFYWQKMQLTHWDNYNDICNMRHARTQTHLRGLTVHSLYSARIL